MQGLAMSISPQAMELEMQSIGADGRPTLGAAFELLLAQWEAGERDRELALHLIFLAWFLNLEPTELTGLDETRVPTSELPRVFNEVHDWLLPEGVASDDAEALYVVVIPAKLAPWLLGDESLWTARGESYRARYRQLAPRGIAPSVFEGRGAYGDYYAGQAVAGGS